MDRDTEHIERIERKLEKDRSGRESALSSLSGIVFGRKILYWLLLLFGFAIAVSAVSMMRMPPETRGIVYVYEEVDAHWKVKSRLEINGAHAAEKEDVELVPMPGEGVSMMRTQPSIAGPAEVGADLLAHKLEREGNPEERFGLALALAGDLAVFGAPPTERHRENGSVFVFRRMVAEDETWQTVAELSAPEESVADFGRTVALNGGMLMIGAKHVPGPGPLWLQWLTEATVWIAPNFLDNIIRLLFRNSHWVMLTLIGLALLYYLRSRLHVRMRRQALDAWRGAVPRRLGGDGDNMEPENADAT